MSEKGGGKMKYFLTFVEEAVLNPAYAGYIGGRVEVLGQGGEYVIDEIRFFTNDIETFYKFRDKHDFKQLNKKQLSKFKTKIKLFQWKEE